VLGIEVDEDVGTKSIGTVAVVLLPPPPTPATDDVAAKLAACRVDDLVILGDMSTNGSENGRRLTS
jgi:hypothetical protein